MTPDREGTGSRWRPAEAGEFGPGCQHPPGHPGHLDESARRFQHEEYAVAWLLAAEGHDVRSLRETRGKGRQPDMLVCGHPVEVKSWDPLDLRGGRVPTARSVLNKLLHGGLQSPAVALYARGRGTTAATVRRGLALYSAHPQGSKVTSLRVVGDGFDLTWSRLPPPGPDPTRRMDHDPKPGRGPARSDRAGASPVLWSGRRATAELPRAGSTAPARRRVVEGHPPPARKGPGLGL